MRKLRNWTCFCAVMLFALVSAACSSGETESAFAGVHVFEGQLSQSGGDYVLQVGDESFTLEGDTNEFSKYTGQTVEVGASIAGSTLRVTRIGPAPPKPVSES